MRAASCQRPSTHADTAAAWAASRSLSGNAASRGRCLPRHRDVGAVGRHEHEVRHEDLTHGQGRGVGRDLLSGRHDVGVVSKQPVERMVVGSHHLGRAGGFVAVGIAGRGGCCDGHAASVQDAPRRPIAEGLQHHRSPEELVRCATVRFRVLGAVELVDPDEALSRLGSPNQRRILAVLLARLGETVALDTLAEAVWGDDQPATAVATLRTYVSRLRTVLGDTLVSQGAGYALAAAPEDVDAGRFESLHRDAAAAEPVAAVALLDAALGLWRGAAFAEHADIACIAPEARRLEELRRSASEARVNALLRAGRVDEAVAAAEALVTAEPLWEGAWARLIEGLAAQGRSAEALRSFQRAVAALAEAGLEPSDALRESERMVLAGEAALPVAPAGDRRAPPTATLPLAPPAPTSSFVGRDDEVAHLVELLETTRIVTLVGTGGVGKTRLAIETAAWPRRRRSLGARLVELVEIRDTEGVADAVAAALGLTTEAEDPIDALDRAGALDVLLVLDNAEHVLGAAVDVVARVVRGGAALRVLATSRERLGVDGEHVRPVAPLATDAAGAPARQLLVERATAIAPDLVIGIDDELVAGVVMRLDGLPLAIEMAAAQLSTMSLAELDAELGRSLGALRSPHRHAARATRRSAPSSSGRRRAWKKTSAPRSPSSRSSRDRSPPRTR